VSRGGRFGKYGETKRLARLRQSGYRRSATERVSPMQHYQTPFFPLKNKITIRPAKPTDKAFIVGLSGKVFSIYGPYTTTVSRWFESGVTMTLISMVEGRPVGFVMIGALPGDREGETRAEVLAIAVTPEFQQRGIGGELLQFAQKRVEELRESRLFLHTAKENLAAQKLFLRHGYRFVETKNGFYPSGQDALMMVNELGKNRNPIQLG
jgi:ribosomal protein S18 acetylase RimI-like enzyme